MAKVSQETLKKLNDFLDSLPSEAQSKCSLCNETLVHLVKTAEVETGAGTATVTRELANRINDGAAPGDKVSGNALRNRVQNIEGVKCSDRADKPEPKPKECPVCGSVYPGDHKHCPNNCGKSECTEAHQFCTIAISQLSRIRQDDMEKIPEFLKVLDWIIQQIHDTGDNNALIRCVKKLESYIDHGQEKETPAIEIPDCHGRNLKVADIDSILIQVVEQYPGRENAQKRVQLLNDSGVPCSTGKKGKEPWTTKRVMDNYRHAKTRQAAKGSA